MAKKSAMSKGYRKTVKKKPFLSKKEIIELIVIVAVILLGIVLFNIFYDDGFIKEDAVQQGDIVAYAQQVGADHLIFANNIAMVVSSSIGVANVSTIIK